MKTPIKAYVISLIAAAGLVTGCNQSVKSASQDFNSLPPAVQKSIRAQAPDGDITSVSQTSDNGVQAYKVELTDQGRDSTMVVATDGRVLSSDLPAKPNGIVQDVKKALTPTGAVGTEFSALPEKVQTAILAHAPQTQIASISRETDNGQTVYDVSFKDSAANPDIKVADDGTLIQGVQK